MEEFIQGSHLPLSYIWAINRGLAKPVTLSNPPDFEMDDKEGSSLIDRLRIKEPNEPESPSKRNHSRSDGKSTPSKSSKRSKSSGSGMSGAAPAPSQRQLLPKPKVNSSGTMRSQKCSSII
jgi:hypothetical protein